MKSPTLLLLIVLSLTSGLVIIPSHAFVCPAASEISPCSCTTEAVVTCSGHWVVQASINNVNSALRLANNLSPYDPLVLSRLTILETGIEELDLSPLVNLRVEDLDIRSNVYLTSIIGPGPIHYGHIDATALTLERCYRLEDEGLGQTLRYFKAESMLRLMLSNNKLKGQEGEGQEFLVGLSAFTELDWLMLDSNEIRRVAGGQFRANNKLGLFSLDSNGMVEIGKDAFLFNDPPSNFLDDDMSLYIQFNDDLKDVSFSNFTGLDRNARPISLGLRHNQLDFLSQEHFEPFLRARDTNTIDLRYNYYLQCDPRMRWLKDQRDIFESRVFYPLCQNDPGKTVFTSELV